MSSPDPLVSVVIPTFGRPELVARAVHSALDQRLREIEVIVVVDGPDPATVEALSGTGDPRLRILPLHETAGVGAARNAGVDEARGSWVALLDDDDEWLPGKLGLQLATARRSRYRDPIVSCCFIARSKHGDVVLPRRFPVPGEALSEYLFCQTRLLGGEGLVLPSTMFASAEVLRRTRFRHRRLAHEGCDWLLRAIHHEGAGVEFVPSREPLAVWHDEHARNRMSNTTDWRTSLAWCDASADLLTPRARASFVLIRASLEAKRARDVKAFWLLLWEAIRRGRPTMTSIVAHMIIWLVPARLRFRIAALVSR